MPYRASAQFQRLEVTSDNWISQVGQEAVRVVTIIESSPIWIIDKAFRIGTPMRKADWTRRLAARWGEQHAQMALMDQAKGR
jgi:hypothetical protein